jgi:transcriptional regulator with XRE-family HTH domain
MARTTDGAGEFGARLTAGRRLIGLSQTELAERSGLSIRAISNLEHGRTRWPYPDSVRRLADSLELRGEQRDEFISVAGRRLSGDEGNTRVRQPPPAVSALNGKPAEDRRPRGAAKQAGSIPRQLPGSVPDFIGRAAELEQLTGLPRKARADDAAVVCVVSGMAGVGKTALAVHWAHRVAERFPDGQLYANLRGFDPSEAPAEPAQVLSGFLDALGAVRESVPEGLDARAGLYRTLLAGKRILVVLDNAHDEAHVRPLLPGTASCPVLVTSRNHLAGLAARDGAELLMLDVMGENDAAELLAARLGPERVAAEPAAVAGLIRRCGRLPLALAIAAARAGAQSAHPLAALAGELRDADAVLDALDAGEPTASVRAVFSWSCRHLSVPARRMLGLLGIHPGPEVTEAAAASLAGIPRQQARRALRELTSASLLAEPAPGRYLLHDLVRLYAAEFASAVESHDDRISFCGLTTPTAQHVPLPG